MSRALATIETISAIRPIEGADAIEAATVRGWTVVVKKGEHAAGDRAVYLEIDAFLPIARPEFAFLAERNVKTMDGVEGHVLRTAKLRGTISQGLLLPLGAFTRPEDAQALCAEVGTDVSAALGIRKYEPPLPDQRPDRPSPFRGPFPTEFAPRTDAERVQNLTQLYADLCAATDWIATEKIDGTSITYINDGGELRVCSRNWELVFAPTEPPFALAAELGILDALEPGMACQAELYGEGIQANPLKISGKRLAVFNVLRDAKPLPRSEWPEALASIAAPRLALRLAASVTEAIAQVDGLRSVITPGRLAEGVVWHSANGRVFDELDGRGCFKAINNAYLLKHGG